MHYYVTFIFVNTKLFRNVSKSAAAKFCELAMLG